MSLHGDRAVIGALGAESGAAYIYEFDGIYWSQTKKLMVSGGEIGDSFGSSIGLTENNLLIGAKNEDSKGSAYIFDYSNNNWVESHKIQASDGAQNDWFGSSVSMFNNSMIVGSLFNDAQGVNSGSAYIFAIVDDLIIKIGFESTSSN